MFVKNNKFVKFETDLGELNLLKIFELGLVVSSSGEANVMSHINSTQVEEVMIIQKVCHTLNLQAFVQSKILYVSMFDLSWLKGWFKLKE